MRKVDFLIISEDREVLARCEDIALEFGYSHKAIPNVDTFAEYEVELKHVSLILVCVENISISTEVTGMVQVIKHYAPEAYIVVTMDSKLEPNVAVFLKKSGANLVLMNTDIHQSNKLEYVVSQKILSSYLPIKWNELQENTTIDCTIYHSLPLNKKFIPIIRAGSEISPDRMKKISEIKTVYIQRSEIEQFQKYCEVNAKQIKNSSSGTMRGLFLSLVSNYDDLILLIIDQSEKISFTKGSQLYQQCEKLAQLLIDTIGNVDDSWEIIQESANGCFGGVARSASIAAYAGLLSLKTNLGNHLSVMTASLLADIGTLDFNPQLAKKIRQGEPCQKWHTEEIKQYKNHPVASLNSVLSRKLQIPEEMKEIILCTHETLDRQGFPNIPRPEKIPIEALIIQVAEKIDQQSFVILGKANPSMREVKKSIFDKHLVPLSGLNFLFVEKMKSALT